MANLPVKAANSFLEVFYCWIMIAEQNHNKKDFLLITKHKYLKFDFYVLVGVENYEPCVAKCHEELNPQIWGYVWQVTVHKMQATT